MHIYIVDDNQDLCEFLAFLLANEGHHVYEFTCPDAALAHIYQAEHTPSILITDYNMPGMNGYELHQHVSRHANGVKTIVISGRDVQHLIGKLHFLHKPFLPEHMLNLVQAIA